MKMINKKLATTVSVTSLTLLLSVFSTGVQAKIYKWTDANGQTHYTATPPPGKKTNATNIEAKIRSAAGKYRAPTKSAETEKTNVAQNNDEQDPSKKDIEGLAGPDKQLIKYCNGQRKNIEQLTKNFRNIWIGQDGKKVKLTQEQRKEKILSLQKRVQEDCAGVNSKPKA